MISRFVPTLLLILVLGQFVYSQEELGVVSNAQLVLIDNVELASSEGGIVVEVNVKPGDSVTKNQTLIVLDFERKKVELAVAQAELAIAEKESKNRTDLEYAAKSIEVGEKLVERSKEAVSRYNRVISQTVIDRQNLELEQAILSKAQAQHALDVGLETAKLRQEQVALASINLQERNLKSPVDGLVVEVIPQVGEWVAPGAKIARIINLDRLRVEAIVPARLAGRLSVGDKAIFEGVLAGQKIEVVANLIFVSPEVHPVNQDFKVWAKIDNSDSSLQPGIVGELRLFK